MWAFLPLAAVLALLVVVGAAPLSRRLDRALTRVALAAFGEYARRREEANASKVRALRAAHRGTTYRAYAAETYLYATVAALAGSVLGVYLAGALLVWVRVERPAALEALPPAVSGLVGLAGPAPTVLDLSLAFLASGATVGVAAAAAAYAVRWLLVRHEADERARRIDATLERNVAFMYALSRSGMAFPEILRILARNREVYGETAREVAVVVTDVDVFGTDVLRAVHRLARRTPSDDLQAFAENLVSVLQSGQSLPDHLRDEYERHRAEAESRQTQFLALLATLAEVYVTVFVAGPLFFVTILVVVGLVLGGTLAFLRAFVYLLLPLATAGFVVYLDGLTEAREPMSAVGASRSDGAGGRVPGAPSRPDGRRAAADGGVDRANRARLEIHRAVAPIRDWLRRPVARTARDPTALLYVTVPVALAYLGVRLWALRAGPLTPGAVDGPLVQATLFVTGTFAGVHEVKARRVRRIEAAVPDFLDRLASTNEAGRSVVGSLERVVRGDLGPLTRELERTWTDVRWGARVERAFDRLDRRLAVPAVTRTTALVTNAMTASGDLGPVLRIAADEAQARRRLERARRDELLTYLVVVYLSFLVFLVIVASLVLVFVPSIPTGPAVATGATPAGVPGLGFAGRAAAITPALKADYTLLLFHAALLQGFCSGLVAGQMGRNSLRAGAKHATVLLGVAYALLLVLN